MHEKVATSFYISFHSNGFVVITPWPNYPFPAQLCTHTVQLGMAMFGLHWGGMHFLYGLLLLAIKSCMNKGFYEASKIDKLFACNWCPTSSWGSPWCYCSISPTFGPHHLHATDDSSTAVYHQLDAASTYLVCHRYKIHAMFNLL